MKNGTNTYGISLAQISWFERLLSKHANVVATDRHDDIVWGVARERGRHIQAICLDEYVCGIAKILEVREEFPNVNLIYVGGMWNRYTQEAKEYCLANQIGLFNTGEMSGALHLDEFWTYYKKDRSGNPVYP